MPPSGVSCCGGSDLGDKQTWRPEHILECPSSRQEMATEKRPPKRQTHLLHHQHVDVNQRNLQQMQGEHGPFEGHWTIAGHQLKSAWATDQSRVRAQALLSIYFVLRSACQNVGDAPAGYFAKGFRLYKVIKRCSCVPFRHNQIRAILEYVLVKIRLNMPWHFLYNV